MCVTNAGVWKKFEPVWNFLIKNELLSNARGALVTALKYPQMNIAEVPVLILEYINLKLEYIIVSTFLVFYNL